MVCSLRRPALVLPGEEVRSFASEFDERRGGPRERRSSRRGAKRTPSDLPCGKTQLADGVEVEVRESGSPRVWVRVTQRQVVPLPEIERTRGREDSAVTKKVQHSSPSENWFFQSHLKKVLHAPNSSSVFLTSSIFPCRNSRGSQVWVWGT